MDILSGRQRVSRGSYATSQGLLEMKDAANRKRLLVTALLAETYVALNRNVGGAFDQYSDCRNSGWAILYAKSPFDLQLARISR